MPTNTFKFILNREKFDYDLGEDIFYTANQHSNRQWNVIWVIDGETNINYYTDYEVKDAISTGCWLVLESLDKEI